MNHSYSRNAKFEYKEKIFFVIYAHIENISENCENKFTFRVGYGEFVKHAAHHTLHIVIVLLEHFYAFLSCLLQ